MSDSICLWSVMRGLISATLGCVLCASILFGSETRGRSQVQASVIRQVSTLSRSPSPQSSVDRKRPNLFRRFFSWSFDRVSQSFRKHPRAVCGLRMVISGVSASKSLFTFCPPAATSSSNPECSTDREVELTANTTDPDDDTEFLYTWTVTGGTIQKEGRTVTWNLNGLAEGTYTATVEVTDGNQHTTSGSTTVTIALCSGCEKPPPRCPTVSVSCSSGLENQTLMFDATVAGSSAETKRTYNWTVTAGKIISGQGTSRLIVDIPISRPDQ
jgi:hypothetical protein